LRIIPLSHAITTPEKIQRHGFAADVSREFEGMDLMLENFILQRHIFSFGVLGSEVISAFSSN
jgi:hypothetical protein